jgi:hypothetical protein
MRTKKIAINPEAEDSYIMSGMLQTTLYTSDSIVEASSVLGLNGKPIRYYVEGPYPIGFDLTPNNNNNNNKDCSNNDSD